MVESVKEFTHIKVLMILFCILTRNNYATRYRPIYSFVVGKSYTFPQLNVGFRNQTEYSNKIYFNYYNMWVLSGVSLIRKYWLKVKVSKDAFLFAIDYAVYDLIYIRRVVTLCDTRICSVEYWLQSYLSSNES